MRKIAWLRVGACTILPAGVGVGTGNPGGSLATRRLLEPPIFDIGAAIDLAAATGDFTGSTNWTISSDVPYDTGAFSDTWLRSRYQDASFNGWHFDVAHIFPQR